MREEYILEQIYRLLDWANKKIKLQFAVRGDLYFEERDMWWASLGENVGSEVNGKNYHFERPVIVLKKFSKDMLLAIPCTTKRKEGSWYFVFNFNGSEHRAVMAQIRTISSRRLIRKIGQIQPGEFKSLLDSVINLIKTNPPTDAGGFSDPTMGGTM